jgi:predicted GTPase
VAGTTRDRHYGKAEWNGSVFSVIDTGGYITGSDDVFEAEIRKQVTWPSRRRIHPLPGRCATRAHGHG